MSYWQQGVVELGGADKFRQHCVCYSSHSTKAQFINLRFLAPKGYVTKGAVRGTALNDNYEQVVKIVHEGLAVCLVTDLQQTLANDSCNCHCTQQLYAHKRAHEGRQKTRTLNGHCLHRLAAQISFYPAQEAQAAKPEPPAHNGNFPYSTNTAPAHTLNI